MVFVWDDLLEWNVSIRILWSSNPSYKTCIFHTNLIFSAYVWDKKILSFQKIERRTIKTKKFLFYDVKNLLIFCLQSQLFLFLEPILWSPMKGKKFTCFVRVAMILLFSINEPFQKKNGHWAEGNSQSKFYWLSKSTSWLFWDVFPWNSLGKVWFEQKIFFWICFVKN